VGIFEKAWSNKNKNRIAEKHETKKLVVQEGGFPDFSLKVVDESQWIRHCGQNWEGLESKNMRQKMKVESGCGEQQKMEAAILNSPLSQ